MKKSLLLLLACALTVASFAQQKVTKDQVKVKKNNHRATKSAQYF